MSRWTDFVLTRFKIVIVFWVVVAACGAATASRTVDSLSYDFGLPGLPAYETNLDIVDSFGGGGGLNDPIVVVGSNLDRESAVEDFDRTVAEMVRSVPDTRAVTTADAGDASLVGDDGRTRVALLYPPAIGGPDPYASALPRFEKVVAGSDQQIVLTGTTVLADTSSGGGRGVLIEVVLGGLGALVVLVLVFTSLLAGLPLLIAAVSILATFLCLLGLTQLTEVSFVSQYLVALIGLGVAIDYSLLLVMRWREERAEGESNEQAVRTAMSTAGRSVLFSGVTVAVSLAALILVPLPFLRSIGLSGLLIPLMSVATSLSLLPVILLLFGPRLQWPRRRLKSPRSRRWEALARWSVRRKYVVIVAGTVFLVLLSAPLVNLSLGSPQLSAYDSSTPAGAAVSRALSAGIAPGVFRPTEVIVDSGAAGEELDALDRLEGVNRAVGPTSSDWTDGDRRLLQVWSDDDPASSEGKQTLERVRDTVDDVGGTPAEDADFVVAVYGNAPWVLLAVVVVTFLLLARALRSLWLPIKALVLNVASIAAAYGITVWIWQEGNGSGLLFDNPGSGAITIWVPVAAFAFLFGLSMDYEVFILSRMREAYDEHGDTDRAAIDGIANTGRLVTSAALILFLSFVALSTVPSVETKILATTLALGIAIDALIVRSFLAPALVAALGHLNWTMPRALQRVLRLD